jgi:hypothetical protein
LVKAINFWFWSFYPLLFIFEYLSLPGRQDLSLPMELQKPCPCVLKHQVRDNIRDLGLSLFQYSTLTETIITFFFIEIQLITINFLSLSPNVLFLPHTTRSSFSLCCSHGADHEPNLFIKSFNVIYAIELSLYNFSFIYFF